MAITPYHAMRRFGMGVAIGEAVGQVMSNPVQYLKDQLTADTSSNVPTIPVQTGTDLAGQPIYSERPPLTYEQLKDLDRYHAGDVGPWGTVDNLNDAKETKNSSYVGMQTGKLRFASTTLKSYRERTVWFFANMFAINQKSGWPGAQEFDLIRPNIMGSFANLCEAVTFGGAMLTFLDNRESVGPNSTTGLSTGRSYNENHAREILELHTLGEGNNNYVQADVVELAKAMTGHTESPDWGTGPVLGRAVYAPSIHEPGTRTIVGQTFAADDGTGSQARTIVRYLANTQTTRKRLVRDFSLHVLGVTAPDTATEFTTFLSSGLIRDLCSNLVDWANNNTGSLPASVPKMQGDYAVSIYRAAPSVPPDWTITHTLQEPIWGQPTPAGWEIDPLNYNTAGVAMRRLAWAGGLSYILALQSGTPEARATEILGTVDAAPVIALMAQNPVLTRDQKFATLALCPQMMGR